MALYFMLEIDLSMADVEIFDRYEALAMPLLRDHGGSVRARVRDQENSLEWHLLRVPDAESWRAYRDDPRRREHDWLLERANVRVLRYDVVPLPVDG